MAQHSLMESLLWQTHFIVQFSIDLHSSIKRCSMIWLLHAVRWYIVTWVQQATYHQNRPSKITHLASFAVFFVEIRIMVSYPVMVFFSINGVRLPTLNIQTCNHHSCDNQHGYSSQTSHCNGNVENFRFLAVIRVLGPFIYSWKTNEIAARVFLLP